MNDADFSSVVVVVAFFVVLCLMSVHLELKRNETKIRRIRTEQTDICIFVLVFNSFFFFFFDLPSFRFIRFTKKGIKKKLHKRTDGV